MKDSTLALLRDRSEEYKLVESMSVEDRVRVDTEILHNLAESVNSKVDSDFISVGCRGDITKWKHLETIEACVDLVYKEGTLGDLVQIIRDAIQHVKNHKSHFIRAYGHSCHKSMNILNAVLISITMSTSSLLVIDSVSGIQPKNNSSFKMLIKFNEMSRSGDLRKVLNYFRKDDKSPSRSKLILKEDFGFAMAGTIAVVLLAISLFTIVREAVFYFFYFRVQISQYLDHQSLYLENNKLTIQSSNAPVAKKKEIIEKQARVKKALDKLSDTIRVRETVTPPTVVKEIKKDNDSIEISKDDNNWLI